MPVPRSHVILPTFRAVFSASASAAIAAAVLDVGQAALRASDPVPLRALLESLAAAAGLYGIVSLLVGVMAGMAAASLRAVLPEGWLRRLAGRLREDAGYDLAAASGLLAVAAAAALVGAIVFVYARGFGLEMASKRNGALSTALVAVAALPFSACAFFPLWLALRPATRFLPRPRTLVALGGIAAAALLAVVAAVASVDWRVINFGPFLALAAFLALLAAHLWVWNAGPGAPIVARFTAARLRLLETGPAAALFLLFLFTLARFGHEPRALALVGEESAGARPILRMLQKLADRDHDGYASILGGGDCNDHDPAINPGTVDVPGNGVDEDCSGEDARPRAARQPALRPDAGRTAPARGDGGAAHPATFDGNLLIITIDTLRADRLEPRVMPNLAAWAKDAVVFENTYAQAPNTPRSFPSFLTSRFPSRIHWARESLNFSPILDDNTTLFEALHEAGLRTIGEFSHFYLEPKNGVSQGFDEWDNAGALTLHDSNTDIAAPRITPRVLSKLRELSRSGKRFVLWTHFFEPHSRYMEHPEFPVHASGFKGLEQKYDGEVSFVDRHVKRVLDELSADGLDKRTAVIIFSDHGEAFGEHRFNGEQMFFHGQTLYDELLRVPLLVRVPGVAARHVKERVMLIDIAPTLVDLVGAKIPPSFQGRSLVPALSGGALADEPVYAELLPATSWQHSWRVLLDGRFKVIDKISENTVELYDLERDPKEQHNLALVSAPDARRMRQALRDYIAALSTPSGGGDDTGSTTRAAR